MLEIAVLILIVAGMWIGFVLIAYLGGLIHEKITLYIENRRYTRKLRILGENVADVDIEHYERELIALKRQAQELFDHMDEVTHKKEII